MMQCMIAIAMLGSGFTGFTEITETDSDGFVITKLMTEINGEVIENTGQVLQETSNTGCPDLLSAVFWVDRNHQNAIADETVICRDGEGILVSWYLNNDRISRYDTFGSEIPLWNFSMPGNEWYMDVAAGQDTLMFSAASNIDGIFAWLTGSSVPDLSLDPGRKQDISSDGLYLVYINSSGDSLICVDTEAGSAIWQTALFVVGSQTDGVEICGDNSRVVASVYDASSGCMVYDMTDGSLVGTPVGNYSQSPARISDDGTRLVNGDFYGRIKFYEFDGTSWVQLLNFYTGHTWATGVGISGDGQTAAGGTMGTSPLRGKVISFDWPAGGSPTQLWQYTDYGDFVTSVDISEDGMVIVAGSWGQYQGTFGDVFTAFDRSGGVIFNLLDDLDEPGSIFSVSVSSDGNYATASGKAVHAREMGNGGQVYSIDLTTTGMEGAPADPLVYWMGEPYPNPTVSQMSIELHVPQTGGITDLAVYSLDGRRVATLNCATAPGDHVSVWDVSDDSGEDLSSGLYLIKLSAPGTVLTRKVMILN